MTLDRSCLLAALHIVPSPEVYNKNALPGLAELSKQVGLCIQILVTIDRAALVTAVSSPLTQSIHLNP